jgi:transposase
MRRGFDGLSRLVQEVLGQDPFSSHVFVSRERGHLIKLLFLDGQGLVLYGLGGWSVGSLSGPKPAMARSL